MKFLIDTHAWLWFLQDDRRLSSKASAILEEPASECLFSLASLWEIAIKVSLGRLQPANTFEVVCQSLKLNQINVLGIELSHIKTVRSLPFHHADPFDRLLVAQAMVEECSMVSTDEIMDRYGVHRIW